jgi:hypothetical protein
MIGDFFLIPGPWLLKRYLVAGIRPTAGLRIPLPEWTIIQAALIILALEDPVHIFILHVPEILNYLFSLCHLPALLLFIHAQTARIIHAGRQHNIPARNALFIVSPSCAKAPPHSPGVHHPPAFYSSTLYIRRTTSRA